MNHYNQLQGESQKSMWKSDKKAMVFIEEENYSSIKHGEWQSN